jgi:hypothetical protein
MNPDTFPFSNPLTIKAMYHEAAGRLYDSEYYTIQSWYYLFLAAEAGEI